jgi:1,4-alpha-glucan branching enzyme
LITSKAKRKTGAVAVVGDFNGWDPAAMPMARRSGRWTATAILAGERRYAFRYVTADGRWFNDEAAHAYEPNGFGGENSILDVTS